MLTVYSSDSPYPTWKLYSATYTHFVRQNIYGLSSVAPYTTATLLNRNLLPVCLSVLANNEAHHEVNILSILLE
jgi:hypothetical protein